MWTARRLDGAGYEQMSSRAVPRCAANKSIIVAALLGVSDNPQVHVLMPTQMTSLCHNNYGSVNIYLDFLNPLNVAAIGKNTKVITH